jgi:hypothetical protein
MREVGGSAPAPAPAAEASAGAGAPDAQLPRLDRMVISTVNLTVLVDNAVDAARRAEQLAEKYGGFVGNSAVRDVNGTREATLTLRVPTRSLNDALAELRASGRRVTDETRSTQDVTEEYTDVESNLRNLRATETQILALMERANRIEEIINLQRELTNLRGQIERLEGRRRLLENRADLATISARFTESTVARGTDPNPLDAFAEAWAALGRVALRLAVVAIWLVVFSPLYGLPLAVIWWAVRHRSARPRPAATEA